MRSAILSAQAMSCETTTLVTLSLRESSKIRSLTALVVIGIESGRGLVKKQVLRAGRQRARERDALLHAVGDLGRHALEHLGARGCTSASFSRTMRADLVLGEGRGAAGAVLRRAQAEGDVLVDAERVEERRMLKDHPAAAADVGKCLLASSAVTSCPST